MLARRVLVVSTVVELFTLVLLVANLVTAHDPRLAAAVGPVHGLAYVTSIGAVLLVDGASRAARALTLVPGIGGLLADRALRRVTAATPPPVWHSPDVPAPPPTRPGGLRVDLTVNGRRHTVDVPGDEPLLDVLRDDLHLTGTKPGCASVACGVCTVLLDGRTALACAVPLDEAAGRAVTTVEGLAGHDGGPHPVQCAFLEEQAAQCGWCTPAQVLTAVALLSSRAHPTPQEVRQVLDGVLCRCGSYQRAVAAVLRAAADTTP